DGSRIAYISDEWSDRGLVGGEVFVIPATGGEPRNLTPGVTFSPSWVSWFPDGERMLYAAWDGVSHQMGVLDEASGELAPLALDVITGGGGGPRASRTPDLRAIVTHRSDRLHPPDVWAGALSFEDDGAAKLEWRRPTHLNALIEETVALAPAEAVSWESADG